jgi:hypothetical protein
MTIFKAYLKVPLVLLCALAVLAFGASPAFAETEGTGWEAYSQSSPTNLKPGGSGQIQVDIFNTGAKPDAGAITVTDTLPAGLEATKAGGMPASGTNILSPEEEELGIYEYIAGVAIAGPRWVCTGRTVVTCTGNPKFLLPLPFLPSGVGGEATHPLAVERIGIAVNVAAGVSETEAHANDVTVAGGGATSVASVSDPLTVNASEPGFGFPGWDVWFTNADGTLDTQAGSHPYEATFVNGFNELASTVEGKKSAGGEARDLQAALPPGFFGDPAAVPRCTLDQLDGQECPAQTQLGADLVGKSETGGGTHQLTFYPVYNIVPPPGVPEEFAFSLAGKDVIFDAGPSSADGYRIVTRIDNIPQAEANLNVLTLWGVPAEASHDPERCEGRVEQGGLKLNCDLSSGVLVKPFLTLPTSCEGPQAFTLEGLSSWTNPDARTERSVESHDGNGTETGFTGCERLSIEPSLSTAPDTAFADTPAGLTAEVHVPQENLTNPTGLVAATLKNTSVTLPEGLVINPGQAAGLKACQEAEANLHGEGPQSCPSASKVGKVTIQTPLLEEQREPELQGEVFVLQSNPPNLRLLVAASADGIYLKLIGDVHLNEATGQVTTTFTKTPELPFTDFKLTFSGGAQAALATPTQCGDYSTTSDFTPWTSPFAADVLGSNSFTITSGPGGSACPSGALPFSPSLTAGSTTDQAGGFTNFSLLLQRGDGQQRIDGLQFKAPAGLTGELSKVPLCPEPQAAEGKCSEASKIGHAIVESGPGSYPLEIPEPGRPESGIYLTGPYKGAPFGLTITTHVLAGPFDLEQGTPCDCIVTRAKIEVNPLTAALTITTDPLPQVVAGVPTDLREIDSVIERPEFMINPTNCDPSEFSGTAYGTPPPGQGGSNASAPISSHFQVGSCQSLKFEPKFHVSVTGKNSKADGSALTTTVSEPGTPQGTQADIHLVKVELPKQLPSRLTTLQRACTQKKFEENPAGCPPESMIGMAVVHTPLLPVPLMGPAIFVSHGGEAFPSLTLVLQGDNVTVDLVGTTYISKSSITSTTFKALPDSPFSSFELVLPQKEFSALGTNVPEKDHYSLCGQKLSMPNEFVAQNGAVIKQSTAIAITGCKPEIRVLSHKVKGKTATLVVSVPAAGKLVVSGKGLSRASKTASGATTLTVKLTLTKAETSRLAKHRGRKLAAHIKLSFTPKKGTKLATTTTVLIG